MGVEQAYLHGAWAARHLGEQGRAPGDIDVLVVGRSARAHVDAALDGLEDRLGREVNVTYVSPERWATAEDDPFLSTVLDRPLVKLRVAGRTPVAAR